MVMQVCLLWNIELLVHIFEAVSSPSCAKDNIDCFDLR